MKWAEANPGGTWTAAEAVAWLDPPLTRRQLAELVTLLRVQPVGTRKAARGRPALVYESAELMELHAAIARWLPWESDSPPGPRG